MADYTNGRFVWRELMTSDVDAAKKFYGELFGWSFKTAEMPGFTYTMIHAREKGVGGMMALDASMPAPPHWSSYLSVADVDATVARARAAGGTIHVAPTDIPEVGRFAVVADPTGASLSPFRSSMGDSPPATPKLGEFCWESLGTTDLAKAQAFYKDVYGWSVSEGGGMATFGVGAGMDQQVASVMAAPPGVPSHWMTYAVVEKLTTAVERAKKLGGTVLMDSIAVPGIGTFAVIQDPQKAVISAFEPAPRA